MACVEASHSGEAWTIEVSNKGKGFDWERLSNVSERNSGLFFAEERLRLFGGFMKVDLKRGGGSRITMVLPHDSFGRTKGQ